MRGVRGAVCLQADDPDEMREAVSELLGAMLERNQITADDVISVILTATVDLVSAFPAAGARDFGFVDVPLLCAQEIDVQGALPRVVRVLMHIESDRDRNSIDHVYLRGAEVLRQDLHP
ncbi:chorismate mutase [Actinomycetes bacterium]|nr:chorismate mutase [Actinomycetes bacterium]